MAQERCSIRACYNSNKCRQIEICSDKAEELYTILENGCDAIIDDREDVRPGAKFNEWELIGIPHRIEWKKPEETNRI